MNPDLTLFGLTFYWYGLIMGMAIALALVLIDYRASRYDQRPASDKTWRHKNRAPSLQLFFQQWSIVLLVGGFVGARLWHVATDWQLYRWRWQEIFSLAQGGLSILGAIIGGVVTLLLVLRVANSVRGLPPLLVTDAIVFGLPFGQVLGRLGNWINQELYGLPSILPWAVTIDPAHRLPGYEASATYHPLFLYEATIMFMLGVFIWMLGATRKLWFGSGFFTLSYLTAYTGLRFLLDFLRLDRPVWQFGLSSNQVVLAIVFLGTLAVWIRLRHNDFFGRK